MKLLTPILLAILLGGCALLPPPQPKTDWGALAKGVGTVQPGTYPRSIK